MVVNRLRSNFSEQLFVNSIYYGGSFNVFDNVWGITTVYQEKRRWGTCSYNLHMSFSFFLTLETRTSVIPTTNDPLLHIANIYAQQL